MVDSVKMQSLLYEGRGMLGCVVFCSTIFGCAGPIKEATEAAAPAAVESAVGELHEPYNRDKIAEILKDEEIRDASSQLVAAGVGGALDSLTEERAERLAVATEAFVAKLTMTFADRWESELGPRLSRSLQGALDESLGTLMSAETEARAGAIARSVAREAALGFQDAVREAQLARDGETSDDADVLAAVGDAADATGTALGLAPWLIAAVAAALGGASGFFFARKRAHPTTEARSA